MLTGTIGAGKTTLAEAISEVLHERHIRHALIDLDWLGQIYPVPEGHDPYGYQLAIDNLSCIWQNFLDAGATSAVIAGTVLGSEQLERLRSAIGGTATTISVALISAPEEVLYERIRSRDSGALQQDFLRRTGALAKEIEAAGIHDSVVINNGVDPRELATKILVSHNWI